MKQTIKTIVYFLVVVVLVAGAFQGYRASAFLDEPVYTDVQGNRVTRGDVLKIIGQSGLQQLLENAAKAAPAPASPVK